MSDSQPKGEMDKWIDPEILLLNANDSQAMQGFGGDGYPEPPLTLS